MTPPAFPPSPWRWPCRANPLNESSLQISPLKKGSLWQKNRGPAKTILRICTPFSCFSAFFPPQPVAFQRQPPVRPLPKKSCQKHYGRFFVFAGMCHNRHVNERKFNPPPSGRDTALVAEPPRLCSVALQSMFAGITARPVAGASLSSLPSFASFAKPPAIQPLPISVNIGEYQ